MGDLEKSFGIDGIDVFIVVSDINPDKLNKLTKVAAGWTLSVVSNRGQKIFPGPLPQINLTDVQRCRFLAPAADLKSITALLTGLENAGFSWVHIEKLLSLNGKPQYSVPQGA